jgi:hypothetical protein
LVAFSDGEIGFRCLTIAPSSTAALAFNALNGGSRFYWKTVTQLQQFAKKIKFYNELG